MGDAADAAADAPPELCMTPYGSPIPRDSAYNEDAEKVEIELETGEAR